MLDGCDYRDDLGQSIPFEDFYRAMANGADTKTAAVGTGDYLEYFGSFLEQGKDVLHASLSSGISSSYEAACEAALWVVEGGRVPDDATVDVLARRIAGGGGGAGGADLSVYDGFLKGAVADGS